MVEPGLELETLKIFCLLVSRGSGLARPVPTTYSGSRCVTVLGSRSPLCTCLLRDACKSHAEEGRGVSQRRASDGGTVLRVGLGEGRRWNTWVWAGAGARGAICLQFLLESWRVDFQQILEYLLRASAMMAAAICCVLTVLRSLGQVLYIRFLCSSQWCRVVHSLLPMRKWRHIEIK